MGIDLWEVIEAAKTKPFGFTAFYPGPGLGGHCIPLDPYYLTWKAREYGFHTSMIEASMMINDHMPGIHRGRCGKILNRHRKALNGSRVLVLGVAYKQDIDDYRESPALRVIEEWRKQGRRSPSTTLIPESSGITANRIKAKPPLRRTAAEYRPCGCDRRTHQCRLRFCTAIRACRFRHEERDEGGCCENQQHIEVL